MWLEISRYGVWHTLDATWDTGLRKIFPVNDWQEFGNMKPAVPVFERISDERVIVTRNPPKGYEQELEKERHFLEVVNSWLNATRNLE